MDFARLTDVVLIPTSSIVPNIRQPRKYFDRKELENLSKSIYENGLIHPITVRPIRNNDYEIIAGERRYRAAVMAGITNIPCIVVESSDEKAAILSLTENMQRQNLTFFEEAKAIAVLIKKYSYSGECVASMLGKSPSYVSNKLRLLVLPDEIQKKISEKNLTERHARALLRLNNEKDISRVLDAIISKKLNVAQTEELINRLLNAAQNKKNRKKIMLFKDIRLFINTLNHAVETMNLSGIEAKKDELETDSFIRYTITIPKLTQHVIKSRK